MAAEGLQITYEEDFYHRLCIDKKVQVKFLDGRVGKCLVAKVAFAEDDIVLEEKKCVAVQNLDDRLENIRVCGNCMKSLETPLGTCERVRHKVTTTPGRPPPPPLERAQLPHVDLLPTAPLVFVCPYAASHGCDEQYCCEECQTEAWQRYHAVICPGSTGLHLDASHPFMRLISSSWLQGGINYADTFYVAFVVLLHVMCDIRFNGLAPAEAWRPFSFFISAPWETLSFDYLLSDDEDGQDSDEEAPRTKATVVTRALEGLVELFAPAPSEQFLFEPTFFSRLLGMVLLNGQERTPPSHFAEYRTFLLERRFPGVSTDAVVAAVLGPDATESERDLLNYSAKGQGIYTIGACMNHSCEPNVYVAYTKANDETLVVVATKPIPAGAELCISYIDEDATVDARQAHLWHHYRFQCRCVKCVRELGDLLPLGEPCHESANGPHPVPQQAPESPLEIQSVVMAEV